MHLLLYLKRLSNRKLFIWLPNLVIIGDVASHFLNPSLPPIISTRFLHLSVFPPIPITYLATHFLDSHFSPTIPSNHFLLPSVFYAYFATHFLDPSVSPPIPSTHFLIPSISTTYFAIHFLDLTISTPIPSTHFTLWFRKPIYFPTYYLYPFRKPINFPPYFATYFLHPPYSLHLFCYPFYSNIFTPASCTLAAPTLTWAGGNYSRCLAGKGHRIGLRISSRLAADPSYRKQNLL